jgi:hypothetical protein
MRFLLLLFAFVHPALVESVSLPDSDELAITALLRSLEEHSQTPSQLLDPEVKGEMRKKSLSYLDAKLYRISFYERSPVVLDTDRTHASQNTRVYFEDGRTKADLSISLKFVKRDGTWYFATYEFLGWPASLIVLIVIGTAVAIGYAATVLVLKHRLTRAGIWDSTHFLLAFIPFAWPHLWRESRTSHHAAR